MRALIIVCFERHLHLTYYFTSESTSFECNVKYSKKRSHSWVFILNCTRITRQKYPECSQHCQLLGAPLRVALVHTSFPTSYLSISASIGIFFLVSSPSPHSQPPSIFLSFSLSPLRPLILNPLLSFCPSLCLLFVPSPSLLRALAISNRLFVSLSLSLSFPFLMPKSTPLRHLPVLLCSCEHFVFPKQKIFQNNRNQTFYCTSLHMLLDPIFQLQISNVFYSLLMKRLLLEGWCWYP